MIFIITQLLRKAWPAEVSQKYLPAKSMAFFLMSLETARGYFILNYLIYVAMKIHPFGDGSVLVLDLNGQYVYFYEALRNAALGEESFLYSFCRSLGGEFGGIYAYYVASPLSYIVCLFPQERILEALLFIFLLRKRIGCTFPYCIT